VPMKHDKAVCIYAANRLSQHRNGGVFVVDAFPDEIERTAQAVDLAGHDEMGGVVVEHTVVESYSEQLHDNVRVTEAFVDFGDRFGHSLPAPGFYTLAVHTGGGHQLPRGERQETALTSIEDWVRRQQLSDPTVWPPPQNWVPAMSPEVPIALTLYRAKCAPEDNGALRVALQPSGRLEE